ncbi:hypothetical protein UVI_02043730 [Ustilaginoidea virens]|uniref:FAD-binding domain-containing protein n=1 Tax=Ustilaginoidea virens TaxID=1159556 RepID=A0A1B5L771_USTVR|nr:hypothetical protein UVI_02043730 [Ustilaginoidea virens]
MAVEPGSHFLAGKSICVIGGGIAGLAFAVGFHKHWHHACKPPKVTVYDRDSPDPARWRQAESYTVSISGYSDAGGLLALQQLCLVDQVLAHAVTGLQGSGCFKIWGPGWREYLSVRRRPLGGLPTASIRIARKDLRTVLARSVESCENSSVVWHSYCSGVEKLASGRMRVHFQCRGSSSQVDCDLVIAADGASSEVRAALRPADRLEYVGAVLRGGLARFPDGVPEPVCQNWGFITSSGVSCFLSPVDRNTVLWAVGHNQDQPARELSRSSTRQEQQAVIEEGARLGSPFREPFPTMVRLTDAQTAMCINGRDKAPFCHDDVAEVPVVYIGDSNHPMSPFAGFGANLALSDARDLAQQLSGAHGSIEEAVRAYDATRGEAERQPQGGFDAWAPIKNASLMIQAQKDRGPPGSSYAMLQAS